MNSGEHRLTGCPQKHWLQQPRRSHAGPNNLSAIAGRQPQHHRICGLFAQEVDRAITEEDVRSCGVVGKEWRLIVAVIPGIFRCWINNWCF